MRGLLVLFLLIPASAWAERRLGDLSVGRMIQGGDISGEWCGFDSIKVKNIRGGRVRVDRIHVHFERDGRREREEIRPGFHRDDLRDGDSIEYEFSRDDVCITRVNVEGHPIDEHDHLRDGSVTLRIFGTH